MTRHTEILKPNEISEATKVSMKTRIISAIIGVIVVAPLIVLGDWFALALSVAVLVIALIEIINTAKKGYSALLYLITIVVGLIMAYWPFIISFITKCHEGGWTFHLYDYFKGMSISTPALIVGVSLLFLTVVLHDDFTVRDACFLIAMVLVISLGIQSIIYIRCLPSSLRETHKDFFNMYDNFWSSSLFIYVLIAAFATDIGAYFTGIFFGKKKINERISPKKTYGGFIGGLVISFLVSGTFAIVMSLVGQPILEGYLDLAHWWNILVLSAFMPIMATLGDFVFSAIKRYYEIKDFGKLIPGHGGILDRLDSIFFTFFAAAGYLVIYVSIIEGVTIL